MAVDDLEKVIKGDREHCIRDVCIDNGKWFNIVCEITRSIR